MPSVQVLRGLAVTLVVLHHYASIEIGKAGVDLFFVISGFIMAHVMKGKTPGSFMAARIHRIFPTYFVALAVMLLLNQPMFDSTRFWHSVFLIPDIVLYLPQAWTLAYEMLFYLTCAAFLLVGWRVAFLAAALVVLDMVYPSILTFVALSPLMLEFGLGLLVAILPRQRGWLSLLLAATSLIAFSSISYEFNGIGRVVALGIPAALLLHGCLCYDRKFDRWSLSILIGNASYSIYLAHWSIMGLMKPLALFWPIAACLSILFGLAFYFTVERPLGKLRFRLIIRRLRVNIRRRSSRVRRSALFRLARDQ